MPYFQKLAGNEVVTVKRKIFKSPMTAALSVVMLIGCVLVLTGCGKKPANELDGTKWIATYIVDSGGMPYTGDVEYEMEFSSETVDFQPDPDIYGYVSGASETYKYSLENGKLSIRLFPIRMFSFGWFGCAGRVVSGYPSCFFLLYYATSSLFDAVRFPM